MLENDLAEWGGLSPEQIQAIKRNSKSDDIVVKQF